MSRPFASIVAAVAALAFVVGGAIGRARAQASESDLLATLVDAERAFARETAKVGVRAGFLAWFARDAIGFRPTLGNAWDQISSRPAPPNPTAVTLEWEPRTGDVSLDGDLGWLTGPAVFTTPDGKKSFGNYLSIWKKTPDGWRVLIDVGADAPSPVEFPPGFVRMPWSPEGRWTGPAAMQPPGVLDAESKTALTQAEAAANAPPDGFVRRLADQARYHRPGSLPLVGRAAIEADAAAHPATATRNSLAVAQSRSLDLGYSYGRYELKPAGGAAEAGYYIRVWRHDASGWKIVVQVNQPDGK